MMCDLAFDVMIYATAAEHMLHRQGIGRMQHIDLAHLWSQYGVGLNTVVVRRVSSEQIVEDLRTTALSRAVIARRAEHQQIEQSLGKKKIMNSTAEQLAGVHTRKQPGNRSRPQERDHVQKMQGCVRAQANH